MSLPSQVNTDKSGKHRAAAMKEPVQHSGEVYYGMGPPALESSHSDSVSSSGVYNPEKGPQSLPHYQQAAPVKWVPQDSAQAPGWSQEAPVQAWGQNFGPYMSGVNVRGQMAFHKGVHEGVALPIAGENQLPGPVEVYRDATQAQTQGRGLEWEQHAAAAMHQAQLQAYQNAHKGVELQGQPHVPSHTLQGPMLQPFQTTFRPGKQQFSSGYYSVFPGNKGVPSLAYGEQPKTQQQLLQQMQQQQQMHHHHQQHQQQQQQQQLQQQQHHLQLQQRQHLQQHQIQQHQMQQQQQLQQMQQQYHQQQIQERQQQMQQMQQQQQVQQQNVPQQEATQPQVQPKQQQTQNFVTSPPPEPGPPIAAPNKEEVQSVELQQKPETQTCEASPVAESCPEKLATNPDESSDAQAAPRRSRRLSKDGQSPLGPPSTNIWSKDPPPSLNGVAGSQAAKGGEVTTGGVIRRRRRASKEINLETLAQKASEMESLPSKMVKEDGSSGRQASMVPLVIPVSVPVHRSQTDPQGGWTQGRLGQGERPAGLSDRIPSVIVARRRSLRNPMTESFGQGGENDPGLDEDGKSKFKRRPRPEPLIIPPHKPATFIPPSLYSSISSYQSNLRSPVRLPDHPLTMPPYTPPPILSPVREGSGLYFSAFLTNIAVSNQILPPPPTPKSATRSLLRSTSSDITPPVLPLMTDATPASLEPRINIGQHYQAEIPELQDHPSSQFVQHKADLVWLPMDDSHLKHGDQETMEDMMNMACCSVLRGGGTNQELVLHCLHECGGDFLETLGRLMLQDPVYPKGHHLAGYHYSGSDCWTAEEKCYFNKGISAYRKDFFMVQKLVQTKTVAQCVEFYYTYKKQVKIGRNGILTFGPPDSPLERSTEAVVDVKSSQRSKYIQGETDDDKRDVSYEISHQARVAQSLQAHDYAGTLLVMKEPDPVNKEALHPSAPHRPPAEPAAKKSRAPAKPPPDPDAIFPCKKCGRVFYKVKSRSAHMKSHAEQEKKAAALRQKEEEEQAAAEARARKAAAAAAAAVAANLQGNGNGVTEEAEVSSPEDSTEGEDDKDEDWH
ncbi:mitotic deacetylase associated SANT domain protein a isoform X4 [Anarhichas minor]|uniref:mitotic deacetylase associated SANT domain protein a isoform X4 n=1 Tax=Anarhichas minor TaxID=65739 RepID=UPI003F7392BC